MALEYPLMAENPHHVLWK